MKPYMLAIAGTVVVGLLLVVGFAGGTWSGVVAVVVIAAICWSAGLFIGKEAMEIRRADEMAELRKQVTWERDLARSRQIAVADLKAANASLAARNEMLTGLLGGEQNIPSGGC